MKKLYLSIPIVAAYLGLAFLASHSVQPWCDEGWFSDPAWNLMTRGAMANTSLDPTATWRDVNLTGVNRHSYWIMPLFVVAQVPWYLATGFGLPQMRWFSTLWGLVLLFAWYRSVMRMTEDRAAAMLALACMAVDFNVIFSASVGRMDMMAVALGSLGIAMYLSLRERSVPLALLWGNGLAACACLTHPNAIFFVADLIFLAIFLDWRQVPKWRSLAGFATPYLAALGGWGLYIAEDPALFAAQFLGNAGSAGGRFLVITHPLLSLRNEVVNRYFTMFGMPPFSSGASVLKLVVLAAFVASAGAFFGMAKFRAQRRYRALMGLFLIHVSMLAAIDGFKQSFYQIYVEPLWIAVLAVVAVQAWRMWPRARCMVAAGLAAVLMVQLSVTAGRWRVNPYSTRFLPALGFLQANAASGRTVMASSEMGLQLGFTPSLIDDYRLGYRSGKRADLIVMDEARYQPWIALLAGQDPGNYAFIQRMLREEYRVVYDRPGYRIYERAARYRGRY